MKKSVDSLVELLADASGIVQGETVKIFAEEEPLVSHQTT